MHDQTPVTTTLLLERLRTPGDEGAWAEFDERFRRVLVAAGLRLGLNRSDSEEATQETMLQAFRDFRAGKYDRSRGRLSSWIIGIAHHRIVDVQRRRRPESEAATDPESDNGISEARIEEAFERALEREIFEDAWAAVERESAIAPSTLRAFELTALRGMPPAEAALACGMTTAQVYVARNRVAKRLQETVERFEHAIRDGL